MYRRISFGPILGRQVFLPGEHSCNSVYSKRKFIEQSKPQESSNLAFAILILLGPENLVMCHIAEANF